MTAYDVDELIERMREDRESDWVHRLLTRMMRDDATAITARELDLLRCASVGLTTKIAAEVLGISHHTARQHQRSAVYRMCAKNVAHAVALALRKGLIT